MRALPPASAEEQHRGAVAPGGAGDDMGGCDWARRRRILRVTVPPRGSAQRAPSAVFVFAGEAGASRYLSLRAVQRVPLHAPQ